MRELEFIKTIENTLSKKSHIGDDCAYLEDLGIVITQDSLVEDIHFSKKYANAEDIAYKSIMVNLSDIYASGAEPKYLTIALSLPQDINLDFIENFYKTVEHLSKKYDFEVVGGDITGAEKIMISICAIGTTKNHNISSRSTAKSGDIIVTTGVHGSSVAGLWLLQNKNTNYPQIAEKHLRPKAQKDFSVEISKNVKRYAMMDSSDGLADAVFKIAQSSNVEISLDMAKIPYDKEIEEIAKLAKQNYKDWIFYGGEDFQLIACLPEKELTKLKTNYIIIGSIEKSSNGGLLKIIDGNKIYSIDNLEKSFNHFKEQ